MKKLILVSATALLISGAAVYAQSDNGTTSNDMAVASNNSNALHLPVSSAEYAPADGPAKSRISYQSQQQFYTDFGSIPGTVWEKEGLFDKATFTENGITKKAFYDFDGSLVGTITDKSFSDLPANAQRYIDKKYAGYAKGDVVFFDDNELNETDMVLFGNPFEDQDNYFIELSKDNKDIVLQVGMEGNVKFFKDMTEK